MARVRLADDWRVVELPFGRWVLEHRDPAMLLWHDFAIRSTLKAIDEAYEQICNGEDVEFDEP